MNHQPNSLELDFSWDQIGLICFKQKLVRLFLGSDLPVATVQDCTLPQKTKHYSRLDAEESGNNWEQLGKGQKKDCSVPTFTFVILQDISRRTDASERPVQVLTRAWRAFSRIQCTLIDI